MRRAWVTLAVGALAMVATLPGRTQGLGLITAPLLDDLHLGQVQFASLNLFATLIGASFALPAGWLIDAAGVRVALAVLQFALGAVVIAMAKGQSIELFAVLLTLTRGVGQTSLSIASLASVGKWFVEGLRRAMGIYSLALGFGFIAAFPGVQAAVEAYGWRAAWLGVGLAICASGAVAAILARDGKASAAVETEGKTLGEALRTPAFWVYGITSALYLLVASGVGLFTELMLRERGMGAGVFRMSLATTAIVVILANFGGGFLSERWSLPRLLSVATALLIPALLAFPLLSTPTHVVLWSVLMGGAGGVVTVVFFTIWPKHFGRANLGKIQGVAQALTVLASAVGPLVFAASHDQTGSYNAAFVGLAPLFALAALASWWVQAPTAS